MRSRLLLLALPAVVACASSAPRSGYESSSDADDLTPLLPPPPRVESEGADAPRAVSISLSGTVYAPNAALPIANTLVYLTPEEPAPLPEGAYCDACVPLDPGSFAISAPDGSFAISTELPEGDAFLVVQKGQFRRVRKIRIDGPGALDVDRRHLVLPARSSRDKGDTIPKMVILKDSADYDKIDESLTKLGIREFEVRDDRALLDDASALMSYQVVFIPCGHRDDPRASSPEVIENLRAFVAAGGKLYVTDWSYEFVRRPFPGLVTWERETDRLGSAATGTKWEAPAVVEDEGLAAWLRATGDASFTIEGNWTTIASVDEVEDRDARGGPTVIRPKVWVAADKEGRVYPTTVSFASQCGRVLYSTYHTESDFGGTSELLAQEKALLYSVLEIGVCSGPSGVVK